MSPSIASTVLGAILILTGIWMVTYQMRKVSWRNPPTRRATVGRGGIKLSTTYPGLVVIAIGAVMVMVGTITS
jgi:hypothetical protein